VSDLDSRAVCLTALTFADPMNTVTLNAGTWNFYYVDPSDTDYILNQEHRACPKLAELENILEECRDNPEVKVLTFSEWERMLELVKCLCRRLKLGFAWHTGSVGLAHRLTHKPSELSGGEMQRAAIARALMANPEVLLADEPTGNLDAETGAEIMELLRSLNGRNDLTIIMVTHDESIAQQAHRIVRLAEGRLEAWVEAA
jgi:ABC-type phosphate/phosphonate transport system ATPase subunit